MYSKAYGGGVGDSLAAQMQRDGVEVPQDISQQPTIPISLVGYLDAFYELDTERSHGVALVRIPWSAIVKYGEHYGFNVDELVYFIRKMDDAHLDKLKTDAASGSNGARELVQRAPRPD